MVMAARHYLAVYQACKKINLACFMRFPIPDINVTYHPEQIRSKI